MRVVELDGDGYARGRRHGEALAGEIAGHMAAWGNWLTRVIGRDGFDYVREMVRETRFGEACETHTPDLMAEVRGLAEGCGADADLVFGLQLMDEEWFHRARVGLDRRPPGKCSSLAIAAPDGPTWIGQNMDLGDYTDGHQVVLRFAPHGSTPGALVFSNAGVLALMGVNDAGVGICVNSLPQLPSAAHGVPVAFMIRRLLQARSLAEAAEVVQALPHATNQHYLIAEPGAVRSFEASAAGVTEYRPADRSRVLHTNHPLSPEQGAPERPQDRHNSVQRLASLAGRLAGGAPGLDALQAALCASDDPENPVCRTGGAGNIGFTCGSMLSALRRGEPVRSWVSAGPPTRGYVELELPLAPVA